MLNRQNLLFQREAETLVSLLVPKYAQAATIKKDGGGYWINVQWNCGVTAPLTTNEALQAQGKAPK
jgi:hypothetical protein